MRKGYYHICIFQLSKGLSYTRNEMALNCNKQAKILLSDPS